MTKTRKVLLAVLPAAALVIGGGAGIAAAAGEAPTAPVTERTQQMSSVQQHAPDHGDQLRSRDGTCDPAGDQIRDRDRLHTHDPIQDHDRLHVRLHDGLGDG